MGAVVRSRARHESWRTVTRRSPPQGLPRRGRRRPAARIGERAEEAVRADGRRCATGAIVPISDAARIDLHRHQPRRAADDLPGGAAGALEQDLDDSADAGAHGTLLAARRSAACSRCRRSSLTASGTWLVPGRGRRAGARAVFEGEGRGVADLVDERERRREIGVGLAGKADDEIAGERDVRPRGATFVDEAQIIGAACGADSWRRARGRTPTAPADAGRASARRDRDGRRSARRPCRADGWWCSAAGRCRGSPRAGKAAGRGPRPPSGPRLPGVDVLAEQRQLAHALRARAVRASATIAAAARETSAPRV